MSDIETQNMQSRALRLYCAALLPVILLAQIVLSTPHGLFANAQKTKPSGAESGTPNCVSTSDPSLVLRCILFSGHLYAVADIDLQLQEIVVTASDDNKRETFPDIFNDLARRGRKPLLVTNAGIYGTDNRPLGLLISPNGKRHEANTKTHAGPAQGNFSWDSAVFQVSNKGMASIISIRNWQDDRTVIAATQSGPQLAAAGNINQSFQPQSKWAYRRTAVGVDQANKALVHLVVSRDPVNLFDLATFLVNRLHCSEALHLDGD